MTAVGSGGPPTAEHASPSGATPQEEAGSLRPRQNPRPASPEGPPTKRQRQHFQESREAKVDKKEKKRSREEGPRDLLAEAGPSNPAKFEELTEEKQKANEELVDRTAASKAMAMPVKAKGSVAKHFAPKSTPEKPREESTKGLHQTLQYPPRRWGYWSGSGRSNHPWALILFSGRARKGDLHQCLVSRGWTVCSIDTLSPKPTDLLDDSIWDEIRTDLINGCFKALWVATPCGTFSPLREKPPGPRVLRTVERIQGLKKSELTKAEQKQLRESNILVHRSSSACEAQRSSGLPWGLENPDHPDDKPSIWKMPEIEDLCMREDVDLTGFDQCRYGLETTKPTIFMSQKMDFSDIKEVRCNHPKVEREDSNGKKYQAAHQSTVQRWVDTEQGRQRASRSQGEYPPDLSKVIATAFHKTQLGQPWLQEDLREEVF